jgi:type II secretory pathway predicted ATPase ExeA
VGNESGQKFTEVYKQIPLCGWVKLDAERSEWLGERALYLNFFGLREQPFGVTPDPRFLYLSEAHKEALACLYYGIGDRNLTQLGT